jgi:hypothetical protein
MPRATASSRREGQRAGGAPAAACKQNLQRLGIISPPHASRPAQATEPSQQPAQPTPPQLAHQQGLPPLQGPWQAGAS